MLFCPLAGGVLELSGVFGGRSSFSPSLAFSARNSAFSARSTAISASKPESRDNSVAISASFSALDDNEESNGGVIRRLTHTRSPEARKIYLKPATSPTPCPSDRSAQG